MFVLCSSFLSCVRMENYLAKRLTITMITEVNTFINISFFY